MHQFLLDKHTKLNASSLYYWFSNKNEIVIKSTQYAISEIINEILEQPWDKTNSVNDFCEKIIGVIERHESYLNVITQVLTSPTYGKEMIDEFLSHKEIWNDSFNKVAKDINLSEYEQKMTAQLVLSVIVKNSIIKDWSTLKREIMFIAELLIGKGNTQITIE